VISKRTGTSRGSAPRPRSTTSSRRTKSRSQ
jgi:hypothetical protein